MTPDEALGTVDAALRAHGLPGGIGLRTATREFIIATGRGATRADRAAVVELLTAMGAARVTVERGGVVLAYVPDRLRPAPPVTVQVVDADSATTAETATVSGMKACSRCRQVLPLSAYNHRSLSADSLAPHCRACERVRQAAYCTQRKERARRDSPAETARVAIGRK